MSADRFPPIRRPRLNDRAIPLLAGAMVFLMIMIFDGWSGPPLRNSLGVYLYEFTVEIIGFALLCSVVGYIPAFLLCLVGTAIMVGVGSRYPGAESPFAWVLVGIFLPLPILLLIDPHHALGALRYTALPSAVSAWLCWRHEQLSRLR